MFTLQGKTSRSQVRIMKIRIEANCRGKSGGLSWHCKPVCEFNYTEKAMAPHSSTFAWKIPWTEEPGGLQSMGSLESDTTEWLHFNFSLSCIGEGNSNPFQCSCLENPRDGEAWWAAVSGVAQSQTRLKRLSSSSSKLPELIRVGWQVFMRLFTLLSLLSITEVKWSEVTQSCPTLCDPTDCSLPGSSHGIFQVRVLKWVAINFLQGLALTIFSCR